MSPLVSCAARVATSGLNPMPLVRMNETIDSRRLIGALPSPRNPLAGTPARSRTLVALASQRMTRVWCDGVQGSIPIPIPMPCAESGYAICVMSAQVCLKRRRFVGARGAECAQSQSRRSSLRSVARIARRQSRADGNEAIHAAIALHSLEMLWFERCSCAILSGVSKRQRWERPSSHELLMRRMSPARSSRSRPSTAVAPGHARHA